MAFDKGIIAIWDGVRKPLLSTEVVDIVGIILTRNSIKGKETTILLIFRWKKIRFPIDMRLLDIANNIDILGGVAGIMVEQRGGSLERKGIVGTGAGRGRYKK